MPQDRRIESLARFRAIVLLHIWPSEKVDVVREGAADAIVAVSIHGADGKPRSGLTVEAALRRPTDARLDQTLTLEYAGDGVYRGTAKGIAVGQWDVIARTTANGSPFEAERRVVLK